MSKDSRINYYLNIAQEVCKNSKCIRRMYGAIIVKNDEIISTGYNGPPRNCVNCTEIGICMRNIVGIEQGGSYNLCLSVHAEMNAIISAARRDMMGSTLYIVGLDAQKFMDGEEVIANPSPCLLCHRLILNAGIEQVYGRILNEDGSYGYAELDISNTMFMTRMRQQYQDLAQDLPEDRGLEVFQKLRRYYLPSEQSEEAVEPSLEHHSFSSMSELQREFGMAFPPILP